jgi:O6-methylguanine-DNA--protein-cysteine methyltransferase
MNRRSTERVTAALGETAARIAPTREQAVLVESVVAGVTDSYFGVESPLGAVYVAAGPDGVRYLAPAASEEEFARSYRERFGRFVSPARGDEAADLAERTAAALAGERVEVPLDLSRATPFQRRVLEVVKGISRGEVRPYVWVAGEAGSPGASRAVGNVMANNPVLPSLRTTL